MTSTNVRCIKAIDCVWVSVKIFLALIVALVPKDIALALIQDHVKVKKFQFIFYFPFANSRLENVFYTDIDECKETPTICRGYDDICTNLRGSHRCIPIDCPYGYMKDPDRKK